MPTSVLLAVLAAAGLLALAPAMVRRYDAAERLVAERALSTARVLVCCGSTTAGGVTGRRQRTVPGRRPINPPRFVSLLSTTAGLGLMSAPAGTVPPDSCPLPGAAGTPTPGVPGSDPAGVNGPTGRLILPASRLPASGPASPGLPATDGRLSEAVTVELPGGSRSGSRAGRRHLPGRRRGAGRRAQRRGRAASSAGPVRRHTPAVYRRRRVFAALVLFNTVELVGVIFVGPEFWIGCTASGVLLLAYLVHLRNRALVDARRRRERARRQAWLQARLDEERRAYQRRLAARREALRRAALARAAAQREAVRLSQRYADWDMPARRSPVRGRPYSQRASGF